jgi:hypothetical protein
LYAGCDLLTGIEQDCKNLINEIAPVIASTFESLDLDPTVSPAMVCASVNLCP